MLYSQLNEVIDQRLFYFRVDFPNGGKPAKNTFTSSHLSSPQEFKKRLLEVGRGIVYKGKNFMLDAMIERQSKYAKEVKTIDYIGYAKEHEAYILGNLAFKRGVMVEINTEDFFNLPGGTFLKSLSKSNMLNINTDKEDYNSTWPEYVWQAFGAYVFIPVAFLLASLFAEQLRAKHENLLFFEFVGEANAGKTTLLKFLWKLVGRSNYEGIDPSKGSLSGRGRSMSQVSNLPVVLIESDREQSSDAKNMHIRGFDWDELKTAFNGGALMSRGIKNHGNETYEPPFKGALMISQNNRVQSSEAMMSRIASLFINRSNFSESTKKGFDFLAKVPMKNVSYFVVDALSKEQEILKIFDEKIPHYEREIIGYGDVTIQRIAFVHAQLLAAVDALATLIRIPDHQLDQIKAKIIEMSAERQSMLNSESRLLQDFWEMYDYLQTTSYKVNHAGADEKIIAINLNHFEAMARNANQSLLNRQDLKKELKNSVTHPFLEMKNVRSVQENQKTIYCWIFKK